MPVIDLFKEYNAFIGEEVTKMNQWEKQWNRATILNLIDLALDKKDIAWWTELQGKLNEVEK